MKIIILITLSIIFSSCVKKKMIERTKNEFTPDEIIVIEFASRLESKEKKYEDYHHGENLPKE